MVAWWLILDGFVDIAANAVIPAKAFAHLYICWILLREFQDEVEFEFDFNMISSCQDPMRPFPNVDIGTGFMHTTRALPGWLL